LSAGNPGSHHGQADDEDVLARIRSVFEAADPVPPGLVERVRFAVGLAAPGTELAWLSVPEAELARGAPEESRTITFDSSSLTIMIRIDANADGTVRVDGWLAPPQRRRVELMVADGPLTTDADGDGRFVFPSVPRGSARLVARRPEELAGPSKPGPFEMKTVVTPALML
jgi:hypothetical protein